MARGGGGDMTITSSSGLAHREGEQPNVEKINRRNFLSVDQIDHTHFCTWMPLIITFSQSMAEIAEMFQ